MGTIGSTTGTSPLVSNPTASAATSTASAQAAVTSTPSTSSAVAPTPPPPPPAKDSSAIKSGSGTSKLTMDSTKSKKPVIETKGDDKWQTDSAKKDLHLNQRDLYGNLMEKVKANSDNPFANDYKDKVVDMQKAFDKAETKGDYKECRCIHKEMQELSQEVLSMFGD